MSVVVHDLDDVEPAPSVVTIGFFDGVHRGHQAIIGRAVAEAVERGLRSVAVTFDVHPRSVVAPDQTPPLLQTLEDRVAAVAERGVDLVVVLPFTAELSHLEPEQFVATVLAGRLDARKVVVGTNFRFGRRAAGDVLVLAELGERFGFEVEAVALFELDGISVSSTAVREALARGDVAFAAEALGRPPVVRGRVVRGEGRGATIGVPTANLELPDGTVEPAVGVYAGRARVGSDEPWAPAVVNVGTRPTFAGQDVRVEVHLLDAHRDLYGQDLEVALHERLRDERRFEGPDALVAQIGADIEQARAIVG